MGKKEEKLGELMKALMNVYGSLDEDAMKALFENPRAVNILGEAMAAMGKMPARTGEKKPVNMIVKKQKAHQCPTFFNEDELKKMAISGELMLYYEFLKTIEIRKDAEVDVNIIIDTQNGDTVELISVNVDAGSVYLNGRSIIMNSVEGYSPKETGHGAEAREFIVKEIERLSEELANIKGKKIAERFEDIAVYLRNIHMQLRDPVVAK